MRSPSAQPYLRTALAVAAALLASACAAVAPWERDVLARRAMQLNPSPSVLAADEHIYYAREGSSGGRTFDGGGCGCD